MNNKYLKLHSLLRMFGALLAIAAFVAMFFAKQAVHSDSLFREDVFTDFRNGAFFGGDFYKGNVLGFIGYLLVLLAGLAGLAFVFIDEMIGKDLTKKLSFVVGGVAVLGAIFIFLFAAIFNAVNDRNDFILDAAPIVFGIFGILVGAINAAAPILEDKGY